jgi:hypothetical protein
MVWKTLKTKQKQETDDGCPAIPRTSGQVVQAAGAVALSSSQGHQETWIQRQLRVTWFHPAWKPGPFSRLPLEFGKFTGYD